MSNEVYSPRDKKTNEPFRGFLEYYNIGRRTTKAKRELERRQLHPDTDKSKDLSFAFSVGEISFEANYPHLNYSDRFAKLSLVEKILFGIGQSAGFARTPDIQIEYVKNIARKADVAEDILFEDRFQTAIDQEIAEGRVSTREDGIWELTLLSVEPIQAAIDRTRPKK